MDVFVPLICVMSGILGHIGYKDINPTATNVPADFNDIQLSKREECVDRGPSCASLGSQVCTKYPTWAQHYCELTCNICHQNTTLEGCCEDQLGWQKCVQYQNDSCHGIFEPWAKSNCQAFCGYCRPCPIKPCEDVLPGSSCLAYGQSTCEEPLYRLWAYENCVKTCNLCNYNYGYYYLNNPHEAPETTTVVTKSSTNMDKCREDEPLCSFYGQKDCLDFQDFMNDHCPNFCGFCQGGIRVSPTAENHVPVCKDRYPNCTLYKKEDCCGLYEPWARANCFQTCGFCGIPPPHICQDAIANCASLGPNLCTNDSYTSFVAQNCSGFCKLCDTPWTPPSCAQYLYHGYAGATQQPTVGAKEPTISPDCNDRIDCRHYLDRDHVCCTIYEPWARNNCPMHCGFCAVEPRRLCNDTVNYCHLEPADLCTNSAFDLWVADNCAGFCKVCDTPWKPAACAAYLFLH